jgi:hypothetical protein
VAQELGPYQKAGWCRGITRKARRQWEDREHHWYTPPQRSPNIEEIPYAVKTSPYTAFLGRTTTAGLLAYACLRTLSNFLSLQRQQLPENLSRKG